MEPSNAFHLSRKLTHDLPANRIVFGENLPQGGRPCMKELAAIVNHLSSSETRGGVLATLVTVKGSSYRRPGARLLVPETGSPLGSISGGCLEEDVIGHARTVAASGQAKLVTYDTTSENDLVWGVGLGCHGVVQVLLEKVPPQPAWAVTLAGHLRDRRPTELEVVWRNADPNRLGTRLAVKRSPGPAKPGVFRQTIFPSPPLMIFGAGDDARPLARLAGELGWHVTVADPRPAFATAARFPTADALLVAPAAELVAKASPGPDSLVVVMTHHYIHDVPLLRALLPRPLAYLGLLGPRQRASQILRDLVRDGLVLTPGMRARLHAPVGLDLGAETPAEVALAILAEMQASLAGRDARSLRQRKGSIHE